MKALRVASGYTQKEVAESIGVSRVTYMKWENYESYPDALQLINLSKLFKCSLDTFYFPLSTS
ncbi:helix-turn-helix transcriptional regulator [Coprococcus catus]